MLIGWLVDLFSVVFLLYISVCAYEYRCLQSQKRARDTPVPGAGVTGSFEPPNMDAGNRVLVL